MAPSDSDDLVELTRLVRGFAGYTRRSLRLGHRLRRQLPRTHEASLLFVGIDPHAGDVRATALLDNMIAAMGWPRDQVGVCATADDATLNAVKPRVMVVLGAQAMRHVLGGNATFAELRGTWQRAGDIDVMPIYHPAELLEKNEFKRVAWQDLQAVMARCAALGVVPRATP
ncbi:MAG: hypothetical protein IPL79_04170 [Myxococcales bacterium]|nr:hypothetical protein [Myxococcales bacterium]